MLENIQESRWLGSGFVCVREIMAADHLGLSTSLSPIKEYLDIKQRDTCRFRVVSTTHTLPTPKQVITCLPGYKVDIGLDELWYASEYIAKVNSTNFSDPFLAFRMVSATFLLVVRHSSVGFVAAARATAPPRAERPRPAPQPGAA